MRNLPKNIALLTSVVVIATLAWPGHSQWDAFALAAVLAMVGLGVLYPWALSRQPDDGDGARAARRDMQEVDVGPATTAILF